MIIAFFKRFLPILLLTGSFLYVKTADDSDEEELKFFFPKAEYEHYMRLMFEIDPYVHDQLKASHKKLGSPFIERDEGYDRIESGSDDTFGYPIIYLSSMLDKSEHEQKAILSFYAKKYRWLDERLNPIERKYVLGLMGLIDPALYAAIVEVDPTGIDHVLWSGDLGWALTFSDNDGLPLIFINRENFLLLDFDEQRAVVAHELGHYVLKHLYGSRTPSHDYFFERDSDNTTFAKGKKVADQLIPYETFRLAANRIREHEADKSAILDFGIDIDVMLSMADKMLKMEEETEDIERHTLKRTHPVWDDRIKHLESLRPEVELRKAKQEPLKRFDWKALAKEYIQSVSL